MLDGSINIDKTLAEFWEIEPVKEFESVLANEEIECEMHLKETYSRDSDRKLCSEDASKNEGELGESKTLAVNRLKSL